MAEEKGEVNPMVGPFGKALAEGMTTKVIEYLDGFPSSTGAERAGIARMISRDLAKWADLAEKEGT